MSTKVEILVGLRVPVLPSCKESSDGTEARSRCRGRDLTIRVASRSTGAGVESGEQLPARDLELVRLPDGTPARREHQPAFALPTAAHNTGVHDAATGT